MKSLRSTLKRVERVGSRFEVLDGPIDDATMDELRGVSDSWMTASGHRERTFTVGRFDPAYLRATTIAVVRDADDRIVAFTNILPSYHSGEGNFDLMRRRPDSVNGVMEFLFVSLIEYFRGRGLTGMNLGLAPLAGVEGGGVRSRSSAPCATTAAPRSTYGGLQEFKAKWRPRWEPRYIAYERDVDLPRIAVGITRVASSSRKRREPRRGAAKRYPFSLTMIGLTLWFSIATNLDPVLRARAPLPLRTLVSRPRAPRVVAGGHVSDHRAAGGIRVGEPRALVLVTPARGTAARHVAHRQRPSSSATSRVRSRAVRAATRGGARERCRPRQHARPRRGSFRRLLGRRRRTCDHDPLATLAADRHVAVFAALAITLLVMHHLFDAQHLVAAASGALVASLWNPPPADSAAEPVPVPAPATSTPSPELTEPQMSQPTNQ